MIKYTTLNVLNVFDSLYQKKIINFLHTWKTSNLYMYINKLKNNNQIMKFI